MKRLFIAIPLPPHVKQYLKKLQQPMEGIKWQPVSQMHLTLRFLGDTPKTKLDKLKKSLDTITHSAFDLTITKLDAFPDLEHPKVLWAGMEESRSLLALHKKVKRICEQADLLSNQKQFVQHITLGRMKNNSSAKVRSFIKQNHQLSRISFGVEDINLYCSRLSAEGAEHEIIKRYSLAG